MLTTCLEILLATTNIFSFLCSLAALLSKFRIDYSDLIVIPDIAKKAKEETRNEFESFIQNFREKEDGDSEPSKFCLGIIETYIGT